METGDNTKPAEEPNEPQSSWQYTQEADTTEQPSATFPPVTWSASEFIDHEKNKSWFVNLVALTAVAVVVIFLLTRDIVTAVAIIMVAIIFGIAAGRKPRTLQYKIDHAGITIGEKFYPYNLFKSFSVLEEGVFSSIQLMPLKRFMPPISLYYPPESEEQVINTLGSYLPHEDRTHDAVDRLMRKIRF